MPRRIKHFQRPTQWDSQMRSLQDELHRKRHRTTAEHRDDGMPLGILARDSGLPQSQLRDLIARGLLEVTRQDDQKIWVSQDHAASLIDQARRVRSAS